ncbi:hypothetical protein K8O93_01025 [Gordonia bronchialis]|uniref:hypothetical protein n=1 Tax=Gordonia bronchialis TaxID=2054 RepID=UPI001CBF7172|nr:hypothetical protein [Gordonia bronchialis]UAK38416.1 hypothetical protein K8O93_01025 [Gordonia bronchialis]
MTRLGITVPYAEAAEAITDPDWLCETCGSPAEWCPAILAHFPWVKSRRHDTDQQALI